MRFVVQRVAEASVTVDEEIIGKIDRGFLVLVGVSQSDIAADAGAIADKMLKKLLGLRIFEDENGKTNLDLRSVSGSLLIVSQFTLYADCKKGNRPSFINAGAPDKANEIYEYIIRRCRQEIQTVETGRFGADMKVQLLNDGPFTVILDSEELGL